MGAGDLVGHDAEARATEGGGGDAGRLHADVGAFAQAAFERVGPLGLDRDDADAVAEPRGHAADEPAAAGGDEDRVEAVQVGLGHLLLDLGRDGALARERREGVVGVGRQGPGLFGMGGIGSHAVFDRAVGQDHLAPEHPHPAEFFLLGDQPGHEDLRRVAQLGRRIGHGGAVIAARGRHDPRSRHLAAEHGVEGAPHLEAAGHLRVFEFQREPRTQAECVALHLQRRGVPHMALDQGGGGGDVIGRRVCHGRTMDRRNGAVNRGAVSCGRPWMRARAGSPVRRTR